MSVFLKAKIIYEAFGFEDSVPMLIGAAVVQDYVLLPYEFLIALLAHMWHIHHEFEADFFSSQATSKKNLQMALIKQYKESMMFPSDDWLYTAFNNDHPSLVERVKNVE